MKILSSLPIRDEQREYARSINGDFQLAHVKEFDEPDDEAEVLVIFGWEELAEETLRLYPRLRWIQAMSAGVDRLPLRTLAEREIVLTNVRGVHQIQMSEHIMWSMLTLVRQGHAYVRQQEKKIWDPMIRLDELYGKTVCIVGAGSIGEATAAKCRTFGMKVLGISRTGAEHPAYDRMGALERLPEFLGESDIVVVILPLTPETTGFFDAGRFAEMKRGAYFINVARGPVVDENALIEALNSGQIQAAALDVFVEEPLPTESPFWAMKNVLLTPHIAGRSPHYTERVFEVFFENLRRYPHVASMLNIINLEKGY